MARVVARKVGPPCELQTLLELKKDVWRGIPEDCGLNSCPVPRGRGEKPLKTTLLQEASRPFRTCQALKGRIAPASCRRAATRQNLSRKPADPEIRFSISPAQRFSGPSEGSLGHPQPLAACTGRISASSAIHRECIGHFTGFPGPDSPNRVAHQALTCLPSIFINGTGVRFPPATIFPPWPSPIGENPGHYIAEQESRMFAR